MEVARLYDQLRLVTRSPLWDGDRLLEIFRLNLGLGPGLSKRPRPRYKDIDWNEVEPVLPNSTRQSYHFRIVPTGSSPKK